MEQALNNALVTEQLKPECSDGDISNDHLKVPRSAQSSAQSSVPSSAQSSVQSTAQWGRELLDATRPYADESVIKSWWLVTSTFALTLGALVGAAMLDAWPLRAFLSVTGAFLMARTFITYHDFMHGAILRGSRLASILFHLYGWFALVPAKSWKKSHNYHHGHVGQISRTAIGAFPLITTRMWREASSNERAAYRASRHPLIIVFGYVTIFAFSIVLLPLIREPKKHWDSGASLIAHGGLIATLWLVCGFDTAFFAVLLPMTVASMLGGYLFFAQHSFKGMIILSPESWTFYKAALVSSSYMRLNRLMQFLTGNIGYHHIHHFNVRIPFYRLPEAMAGIPALQSPITTSLAPRDILACFRANLWDEDRKRMVTYGAASA